MRMRDHMIPGLILWGFFTGTVYTEEPDQRSGRDQEQGATRQYHIYDRQITLHETPFTDAQPDKKAAVSVFDSDQSRFRSDSSGEYPDPLQGAPYSRMRMPAASRQRPDDAEKEDDNWLIPLLSDGEESATADRPVEASGWGWLADQARLMQQADSEDDQERVDETYEGMDTQTGDDGVMPSIRNGSYPPAGTGEAEEPLGWGGALQADTEDRWASGILLSDQERWVLSDRMQQEQEQEKDTENTPADDGAVYWDQQNLQLYGTPPSAAAEEDVDLLALYGGDTIRNKSETRDEAARQRSLVGHVVDTPAIREGGVAGFDWSGARQSHAAGHSALTENRPVGARMMSAAGSRFESRAWNSDRSWRGIESATVDTGPSRFRALSDISSPGLSAKPADASDPGSSLLGDGSYSRIRPVQPERPFEDAGDEGVLGEENTGLGVSSSLFQ